MPRIAIAALLVGRMRRRRLRARARAAAFQLDLAGEEFNDIVFDLDKFSDSTCYTQFRFYKSDIEKLAESLQLPPQVVTDERDKVPRVEALCIVLRRLAYPVRYNDLRFLFGRKEGTLSRIFNCTLRLIYDQWKHLLEFHPALKDPEYLKILSQLSKRKLNTPLDRCFGFVDGTVRPTARPKYGQRASYNGHKRTHALKYQSVMTPRGILAHLWGPIEGRRHDLAMLRFSERFLCSA